MKSWHTLFLAIWLILIGLVDIIHLSFSGIPVILAILAILAGLFLIFAGKKINRMDHFGSLMLAIWLILKGMFSLFNIDFSGGHIFFGVLAVFTGFLFLLDKKRTSHRFGVWLLAIWLILTGLIMLINLSFSGLPLILGILALASGILLLIQKAK